MTNDTEQTPPEGFTLEGEQTFQRTPDIYVREAEPTGVGGTAPGFDGGAPDDLEIVDDGPQVDPDV